MMDLNTAHEMTSADYPEYGKYLNLVNKLLLLQMF